MQTIPTWLQQAFCDWLTRRLYLDGGGNYRLRPAQRIAPCNRKLRALYPDNQAFHTAAHAWLALWDSIPTARLNRERHPQRTRSRAMVR
jgi:hypothetical protein